MPGVEGVDPLFGHCERSVAISPININLKKDSKYVKTTRNTDYQQANSAICLFLLVY
jgi:hypothetical protein